MPNDPTYFVRDATGRETIMTADALGQVCHQLSSWCSFLRMAAGGKPAEMLFGIDDAARDNKGAWMRVSIASQ